ncbi:MAG: flagellar brake domain-containing protein [Nitrospirae bacterium]|nr:flagellar brake domain-containing protein [Nitrospirota bacterium]
MDSENAASEETCRLSASEVGAPIEITTEAIQSKVSGFIVDIKSDIIIIKTRGMDGLDAKLPSGTEINVKCFIGENIYKFSTVVKDITFEPTILAIIAYPESIQREERRDKQRIECKIPCVLVIKENKIKACVQDISPTGCKCSLYNSSMLDRWSAKFLFEDNCAVEVVLPVGGTKKEQPVKGTIKYINTAYDKFDIGIEFQLSVEEERNILETILKRGW